MRSRKALKNILANLILQITVALSGLILPRFFIIAYGSAMNGMIVSVTQFISYLALVEAGVSAASIVGLYKPLADNNIDEINRILSATKRFYYRSGIAYVLLLVFLVVLGEVFPELYAMKGFDQRNKYHKYDVLEHCIHAMEAVKTTPENREHMKTAALFHDIGKPLTYSPDDTGRGHFFGHAAKGAEVTAEIMKRFRVDKAFADRVVLLVKYHDMLFERDERLLKKWMRKFTPEVLFEILAIKFADNMATGNMTEALKVKFSEIEMMMRGILEQEQCFSLKDLAVGGSDLLNAGMEPGPAVGVMLEVLLEKVTDGELENSKAVLMAEAERILSADHE